MNNSDKYYIKLIKEGDVSSYSILVDRYKQDLFDIISDKADNSTVAEEITKATFVKAFGMIVDGELNANFKNQIINIAQDFLNTGENEKK